MPRFCYKGIVGLVILLFRSRVIVICHDLIWLKDLELCYGKYLGLLSSLRFQEVFIWFWNMCGR